MNTKPIIIAAIRKAKDIDIEAINLIFVIDKEKRGLLSTASSIA